MKQRLLLALLALFVSVGMVKAAGELTITIPADQATTKGDVVITASGGSNPSLSYSGTTAKTITIKQTDREQSDLAIDASGCETITIKGKVTSATLTLASVKTLSFTGNGELSSLTLTSATGLTKLEVSGNKLDKAKVVDTPTNCVTTWGTQTVTSSASATPANKGVKMATAFSSQLIFKDVSKNKYAWAKKNKDGNYVSANEAQVNGSYTDEFLFYNSSTKVYTDGDFQCTVTNSAESGSLIIQGITISPAEVSLDIKESDKSEIDKKMGEIKTTSVVVISCPSGKDNAAHTGSPVVYHQGDILQISATPETNYVFDKFDAYKDHGLVVNKDVQAGSSMAEFKVQAIYDAQAADHIKKLTIQAVFKGKEQTINFEKTVTGGTFTVTDSKGTVINNGDKVEYGKILTLTATPDVNYEASYLLNGVEPADPNTIPTDFAKSNVAKIQVTDNLNITVSFATTTDPTYKLTFVWPEGKAFADFADVYTSITIASVTATKGSGDFYEVSSAKIKPNTTTYIKVVMEDDYIISSGQVAATGSSTVQSLVFTPSETAANTYTASFIAPEDGNANITLTAIGLADLTVNVASAAQEYTYDGKSKEFAYTTDPSGLKLDVLYKNSTNTDANAYTTSAPTAVGEYDVKYSRKAKDGYKAITEVVKTKGLKINPAKVELKTAPSVTAVKNTATTKYDYKIGTSYSALVNGKAVTGKFDIIPSNTASASFGSADAITECESQNSHNALLRFKVMNGDTPDANYEVATKLVEVIIDNKPLNKFNVTILPLKDVTVEMYNGDTKIDGKNIPTGTKVKLVAIVDGYKTVKFVNTTVGSSSSEAANQVGTSNRFETAEIEVTATLEYKIELSDALENKYTFEAETQTYVYSGEVKPYKTDGLTIKKADGTKLSTTTTPTLANFLIQNPIFYKDASGKILEGAPVNAGNYSICIETSNDYTTQYAAQTFVSDNKTLQISKKDPTIVWPTKASKIGRGQKLNASVFSGGSADVTGTFSWENGSISPADGERYTIVFTPSDEYIGNYNVKKFTANQQKDALPAGTYDGLKISVSDKPVLAILPTVNGEIVVKDKNGVQYHAGNEIDEGTVLQITTTPNDGFELGSLTVNGATNSGSFTVAKTSIEVAATFKLKSSYDPNTQYTVTLPAADAVKGVVIGKSGVNAVAKGGSFAFTLSTLAVDSANVVVKVDGIELKAVNGTYTINPVDANKTVTVALATPTKIKVSVPREVKNANGYVMGKVEVEGLAADSTCYYGDEVTIVAFPESGVTFGGWSGAITSKEKLATFTVTEAMKIAPVFSGIPTGIEDLKIATTIRGEQGSIFFSCNGEAKVIIISMDGRTKVVEVSGETRIPMSTGVYGVVLEQGSQVIKQKVIVR